MGLLDRMSARRDGVKLWKEPPFWAQPESLFPMAAWSSDQEKIGSDYASYIEGAFKASPPVFSCIRWRMNVLSEARFKWRQVRASGPGDLFGTADLALLESPWPNGTTGDLIARMEVMSSLAGNYYATVADDRGRVGRTAQGNRRIVHLRPDWVTIVIDSWSGDPNAADARVVGYIYDPVTSSPKQADPIVLLPEEVVHFAPIPDPAARFRGMSWLTSILNEVEADQAATRHKARFFQNGATPQMAVILGSDVTPETFKRYVALFKDAHQGADKAYKTLFLAGGADVRPLSASFSQMDFKPLQGLAETRIAAAAGIHPVVVGFSEGLQGSSLNAGNFNAAARLTANTTLRPWWRNAAESWSTLVPPPGGAELWYDDRDIAFLREDGTDLAAIAVQKATVVRTLSDGGWDPDAAVRYANTNDITTLIGQHSGLMPVQMRPPGSGELPGGPIDQQRPGASLNGNPTNGSAQAALRR